MSLSQGGPRPARRASLSANTALRAPGAPLAAALLLLSAAPAVAQQAQPAEPAPASQPVVRLADASADGKGVEEVVVTARHRSEKAQKVPIALSAVASAKLDAVNIVSINQLQFLVPTLQVIEANPRNTAFNIRGVGANVSITNDGLEGGVGVYVDGVLYARPGTAAFAYPDIDNIQVLRGPQGTLFGKNATAGAIDVQTRLPSFTPQADLEASVGNYGYWQVKGTVSDGFNDKVAVRVSFVGDARDGTITSTTSGQHYNSQDDKAVRIQLLVQPNDDLTLRFIADYAHQLDNCCISQPRGVFTTLENGTILPFNFYQRSALLGYGIPPFDPFSYKTVSEGREDFEMETAGFSLQADYTLNDFTLTSISAWRLWNWWPFNGAINGSAIPVFYNSAQIDWQRQVSQEFRVTSPTGGVIDYTGGLYFFYQDLPGYLHTAYGPAAGRFILGASKLPAALQELALNGFNMQANTDTVTNSYAAYGQATYHVLPGFDITTGLRYTYEDKSGSYNQSTFGGGSLDDLSPKLQSTILGVRDSVAEPFDYYKDLTHNAAFSYLITPSYKVADNIYTYATYSRGNKSEGINVTLLPAGINAVVKPERVDNYELGVKTNWFDNRLVANADVFWIEDSDYQGNTVAPLSNGTYVYYLASVPKVQSKGFELDTHAKPFDWLTLNWSGAFTDASYESYPDGQCPPEIAGAAQKICSQTGEAVPGTSRWTTSLGGEITQPVGAVGRYDLVGYFGADFSLRSSFYVAANDSKYALVPGYGLLDVRLGVRTDNGKYDLFLWSHNATDTHYFTSVGAASPVSGLYTGGLGDPITFGATVKVHL